MNYRVIVLVFILAISLKELSAAVRKGFANVHQFRMHGFKLSFAVLKKLSLFSIIISTINFTSAQSRFSVRTNIGTTFTTDNGNWHIGYSGAFNGNRTSWFSYDYSYKKKYTLVIKQDWKVLMLSKNGKPCVALIFMNFIIRKM